MDKYKQRSLVQLPKSEQQNLTLSESMHTDKSERSLSPLSKEPHSIGKLFKSKRVEELNPESSCNYQQYKKQNGQREKSPVSIGINTSKVSFPAPVISAYNIYENEVSPVTHMKMKQDPKEGQYKLQQYNSKKIGQPDRFSQQAPKRIEVTKVESGYYPGVVEFPSSYLYDESSDLPETPDLPNRLKPNQSPAKDSPIQNYKKAAYQQSEAGLIKHQNKSRVFSNSAPKNFAFGKSSESQIFQSSSPQFPYINKIEKNINGFKKFVNQPSSNWSSAQISYNKLNKFNQSPMKNESFNVGTQPLQRRSHGKNIGEIIKKLNQKFDPEQEQKLEQKRNFRISVNNFPINRRKLPTFRQQNKQQFQQQVDLDRSSLSNSRNMSKPTNIYEIKDQKQNKDKMGSSKAFGSTMIEEDTEYNPGTIFSNSFIKNTSEDIRSEDILIIDLRTSIRKIKQALIEGEERLAASFNIPQIFYHPPSAVSTSQELHSLMLEVFSFVGINPQIVSIKKYINCVVMREKKLCIVWNFSGKIYFGGWKRDQSLAEGNKDGIGVEWVPSRYIYYGEFKDNKKEGYGVMKKANKQIYIGCWKSNQRWGWGKVYDPEGRLHQNGQFIEGCFIYPQKGYREINPQEQELSKDVGI